MRTFLSSKLFRLPIATITSVVILSFSTAPACSISYPIWSIRERDADALFRFITKDGTGYIDTSGKVVARLSIPHVLQLRSVINIGEAFHEGLISEHDSGPAGPHYFLDRSGNRPFNTQLGYAHDFHEGLAAAQPPVNGKWDSRAKWGFIDHSGAFMIRPQFDSVSNFSEGLALVNVSGKYGYIDKMGSFQIPPTLPTGSDFHEGFAVSIVDEPCNTRRELSSCGPVEYGTFSDLSFQKCKVTFIDRSGRQAWNGRYDQADSFSEGLAAVEVDGKWGYIDKTGGFVIEPEFYGVGDFSDGLARITDRNTLRSGYIDRSGRVVISPRFRAASNFSDGYSLVYDDPRPYFVDRDGKLAFNRKWEAAAAFMHGLAPVQFGKKGPDLDLGYINTSGKVVLRYLQPAK